MKTELLDKVNRKINLDAQLKDWKRTNKGIYEWFKLIRKIDDTKLQRICGTDIALYLVWLRYTAIFFGLISVINVGIIWLYIDGKPTSIDDYKLNDNLSVMQAITILNITANKYKVVLVFFNSLIIVTGMAFFFLFKYMTKFQTYNPMEREDSEDEEEAIIPG